MIIQDLKNTWLKLAGELEHRYIIADTAEEKAVYRYLLENIIPDELELLDSSDDKEDTVE